MTYRRSYRRSYGRRSYRRSARRSYRKSARRSYRRSYRRRYYRRSYTPRRSYRRSYKKGKYSAASRYKYFDKKWSKSAWNRMKRFQYKSYKGNSNAPIAAYSLANKSANTSKALLDYAFKIEQEFKAKHAEKAMKATFINKLGHQRDNRATLGRTARTKSGKLLNFEDLLGDTLTKHDALLDPVTSDIIDNKMPAAGGGVNPANFLKTEYNPARGYDFGTATMRALMEEGM